MRARAPGKLVLSGAYSVLEGAPALVAAVDRYVLADTTRSAERVTPEVVAALELRARERVAAPGPARTSGPTGAGERLAAAAPWFDASALRAPRITEGASSPGARDRKLGLGSSAAILVASLAALELARDPAQDQASLAARVFPPALAAHRLAQGGGSGVDVAASCFGGFLRCEMDAAQGLRHRAARLPEPLCIEVWSGKEETSTRDMLARVGALRAEQPASYRSILDALGSAAERAARAADPPTPGISPPASVGAAPFLTALREQLERFRELGRAAGCPIVPDALAEADRLAEIRGAVVIPSGAGGLEVVLWIGRSPSDPEVCAALTRAGLDRLELGLGARGVHAADSAPHVSPPDTRS